MQSDFGGLGHPSLRCFCGEADAQLELKRTSGHRLLTDRDNNSGAWVTAKTKIIYFYTHAQGSQREEKKKKADSSKRGTEPYDLPEADRYPASLHPASQHPPCCCSSGLLLRLRSTPWGVSSTILVRYMLHLSEFSRTPLVS